MTTDVKHNLRDERGATAVEYGLLVGFIAAVLITVMALLGTDVLGTYNTVIGRF